MIYLAFPTRQTYIVSVVLIHPSALIPYVFRFILHTSSFILFLTCSSASAELKHVIIFIADGWGYNQLLATDYWQGVEQAYESFPVKLAMSTYSWNTREQDSLGYDPMRAHNDWDYLLNKPTDSASSATAMSTGVKARDKELNIDPLTNALLLTIQQRAEELGKSTGVVTSVQWSHATPAGFVAHDVARRNYAAIATEMLDSSGCEVIMGCGHPLYDEHGHLVEVPDYRFVGGRKQWRNLTGRRSEFTLVETRSEFRNLMTGDTPARVCGTAQIRATLQQERPPVEPPNEPVPPFTVPLHENLPTLDEMTRGALNVLDNNPSGFFLMVEGGAVDWACHNHQLGRCIEEMIAFNDAIQVAIEWLETNSSWDESLIIVTGDHECGYLWGPNSGPPATWNPIVNNGSGNLPSACFYFDSHSNSLIPFFSKGLASEQFTAHAIHTDPLRGAYLDNTDIAKVIFEIW